MLMKKEIIDDNKKLREENRKQKEEIERLNNIIDKKEQFLGDNIKRLEREIVKRDNIINELEKWCLSWKENDKYCYLASNDKDKCRYDIWEEVLDKLQELKGSNKE